MVYVLLLLGIYPFVIYPMFLWVFAMLGRKDIQKEEWACNVAVIIAAYNEEDSIGATIENKLEQRLGDLNLNVIVVSDASTDQTEEIVEKISARDGRVRLIRQEKRQGKTAALNRAVAECDSEIIVFSDANSLYEQDAIANLVMNFSCPDVGYVTGKMIYQAADGSVSGDGCSAYMRYENRLRELETRVGSIVGVDGGIDAVRRSLYAPMRDDQLPDFVLPLSVVKSGYRVVYDPLAVQREESLKSTADEFRMRVRVTTRALWALIDFKELLNPLRYGLYSWQLLSHKWLRYLSFVPFGLAVVLSTLRLGSEAGALVVFISFAVFSVLTIIGLISPALTSKNAIVRWCVYFSLLNFSSLFAAINIVRGKRIVVWKPRLG